MRRASAIALGLPLSILSSTAVLAGDETALEAWLRARVSAPRCGDGLLDPGEACDHGARNGDRWSLHGNCNSTCTGSAPFCGDGVVDREEICDDGLLRTWSIADRPICRADCRGVLPYCGDGILDRARGETCELGAPGCTHCQREERVRVEDFGAVGDGKTDDTDAINRALTESPPDATIGFKAGRTYVICTTLTPQNGQRLVGYGATIRRCAQPVGLLSAPATAGQRALVLQDSSMFHVGMYVTPVRRLQNGKKSGEDNQHRIIAITGSTLHLNRDLRGEYDAGAEVVTAFRMIDMAARSIIAGLRLDGNRSRHDAFFSWARHQGVETGADTIIRDAELVRMPNDAVLLRRRNVTLFNNYLHDLGGSAIHASVITGADIIDNVIESTNHEAFLSGHSEGAVTFSQQVHDLRFRRNQLERSSTAFFGELNCTANDQISITNNRAFEAASGFVLAELTRCEEDVFDIEIRDNLVVDTNESSLFGRRARAGNPQLTGVRIEGNRFEGSYLDLRWVHATTVAANLFIMSDSGPGAPMAPNNRTERLQGAISARESQVHINNNDIVGGRKGALLEAPGAIELVGNRFYGQSVAAIHAGFPDQLGNPGVALSDGSGFIIRDNTLVSRRMIPIEVDRYAGFIAWVARGATFSNNCVVSNESGVRLYGLAEPPVVPTPVSGTYTNNRVNAVRAAIGAPRYYNLKFEDNVLSRDLRSELATAFAGGYRVDHGLACP